MRVMESRAQLSVAAWLGALFHVGAVTALLTSLSVWTGIFAPPVIALQDIGVSPASFHVAAEMFAVLVSILVFSTGFHIPDKQRGVAPIILAAAFLAVGLLDFLHVFSYPDMPDFLTPNTPHKATLLSFAGRFLAAVTLLVYVLLAGGSAGKTVPRRWLLAASIGYVMFWGFLCVMSPPWFTAVFGTAQHLAAFKNYAGQLVIGLHLAALVALSVLALRRILPVGAGMGVLAPALMLLIAAELCLTISVGSADTLNMSGHTLKAVAYLLLYRGMFVESVQLPILRLDLARSAVAQAKREWEDTFDAISDLVFIHDADYRITRCNHAYARAAGLPLAEIVGRRYYEVFPKGTGPENGCLRTLAESKGREQEIFVADQGRYYNVQYILVVNEIGAIRHSLHIMNDITERRRYEEELLHQATHDALTGLANRTLLKDRLGQAMGQATRKGKMVAAMLLDLDNFKAINNSFGHAVGDELLVEVAGRLRGALRLGDTVTRFGGDEFVVILPDIKKPEEATRVVDKILGVFAAPVITKGGVEIFSGGSLGIAIFPQDGEDTETILRHADVAMYQAKQAGRGTYAFFTSQLDRRLHEELHMHGRLKHALEEGTLALHYQPQVDIATGEVSGVEALLRWHDSELGDVSPARFIPIAEATGLILPLGDWVLSTACRQIAAWEAAAIPLRVAVNLSGQQFRQHDLVEKVRATIAETGASPGLLEIEITETAAMENVELAAQQLAGLTPLGLSVSLDDFGTGYSSLAYLKTLPIAKLKIDRSFIKDIGSDRDDEVIVQAVIGLARNLNLGLVAEGVETETQLAFLREHGCQAFQGWIFSRALPADELEARLCNTHATRKVGLSCAAQNSPII
ncbi:MAG: EAL domain-containing protein [Proteobacteria bacterium]|nr:EAL domain-containing protein [Pseudomonadota bacterium]MBU4230290.1 EAL domain-containing protein [Pseudomonadota bacterium]MCG2824941.1 EAL domain-containing protein [Desulfobulbaceae bacterium]